MKKVLTVLLCLALLCGCAAPAQHLDESIDIVTTIFPIYDFVRAVGGDKVNINLLIDPGTEVHSYEPTPSDIMDIYDADVFMYIGGESDAWVDGILADCDVQRLALMGCAGQQPHQEDHDHRHEHLHDEHIWTSPRNAKAMVEMICSTLCGIDSKNTDIYKENCLRYLKQIDKAADEIRDAVNSAEDKFILVADRFPYIYLADEFGIEYKAAFGGCAVSTDISLKVMSELIETVEKRNCKAAFHTELSNRSIADALADQTDVELIELHSAHNVTLTDFKSGVTYVDIMLRNAAALKKGMG